MTVADMTLLIYALTAWGGAWLAGRAWTLGAPADRDRRVVALGFGVVEATILALYVVWTYDWFHRSAYMVFNTSLGALVAAGWVLVWFALRDRGPLVQVAVLGPWAVVGVVVAAWSMVDRRITWPPFGFFALSLLVAPAAALVPRLLVRGYRPGRDRDFLAWVLLSLTGLLALAETVALTGLVFSVPLYGRPPLLHVFVAATVVLAGFPPRRDPHSGPASAPASVPWHLFNPPLSPREADLVPGLRRRLTNKELAAELGVSESTVKKHLVSLFRKAGVDTRRDLFERLDAGPQVDLVPNRSETGP